jgi:hypothetical protein
MSKEATISADPDSELAHAVEDVDVRNITVVVGDRRFRMFVERPESYWDSTTLAEHFTKFNHLLDGIEPEALKSKIRQWRRDGSRESIGE